MRIEMEKFGKILVSRPAGKEALAVIEAYLKPKDAKELIELDFSRVLVVGPSWLDEVLTALQLKFGSRVVCLPTNNLTVVESLKVLSEP